MYLTIVGFTIDEVEIHKLGLENKPEDKALYSLEIRSDNHKSQTSISFLGLDALKSFVAEINKEMEKFE
jgi:hypothetical protein